MTNLLGAGLYQDRGSATIWPSLTEFFYGNRFLAGTGDGSLLRDGLWVGICHWAPVLDAGAGISTASDNE